MKQVFKLIKLLLMSILICACAATHVQDKKTNSISKVIERAEQQIGYQVKLIEESGKILNARTIENGKVRYISRQDWTSGFFPGTMFYMYDLTGDQNWLDVGVKYTENLDTIKHLKWHHDVGFMINSSFGNALRITQNEAYEDVMVEAAKS